MKDIEETSEEQTMTIDDLAALYPPAKSKREKRLPPAKETEPTPAVKPTEPATAVQKLKAWVRATYPDELHVYSSEIGYYAASPDMRTTEAYELRNERAKLMYYAGWGANDTVETKLQAATKRLDLLNVTYTWQENSHGFEYLLVDGAKLPEPE